MDRRRPNVARSGGAELGTPGSPGIPPPEFMYRYNQKHVAPWRWRGVARRGTAALPAVRGSRRSHAKSEGRGCRGDVVSAALSSQRKLYKGKVSKGRTLSSFFSIMVEFERKNRFAMDAFLTIFI